MMDSRQTHQQAERRFWAGTVQGYFRLLELDTRTSAGEISESLAVFCQDGHAVSTESLALLAARSFCSAGDCEAAARVLRHDRRHGPHAGSWLDVLSSGFPFPELYPLFSSRALRPQKLTSAGILWVLDLERFRWTPADRHELMLLQTVRGLTETISGVWKKTDGRGTLGIKGLPRLARFLRGRRPARLFLDHIHGVLALCARKNGWPAVPSVLLFDL